LHVGDGVKTPRVVTKTPPVVPEAALASGIAGDVVLSVVVDRDGRVATARVVSGPAGLRNAALEAVQQWSYEPAIQDGRPVAVQIYVTVDFPRH
jgi:TonB family protein